MGGPIVFNSDEPGGVRAIIVVESNPTVILAAIESTGHCVALFDGLEEEQSRTRLNATMDQINDKYGMSTLAPAAMLTAYKAAPTRIAFNSIPDLF